MSAGWQIVIGLECHAQLACATKMFCACRVASDDAPNHAVCPICLAHPGTMPALNAEAVALGVRAAVALSCTVHPTSSFARKHYFYPDLPKGYQITQGVHPLATDGALHVEDRRFSIRRLHLEEDAGKMVHTDEGTFVDWNRAGVPLIEIVSAPDLASAADAEAWLRTLHAVLVEGGICHGDMEKGQFRCDANVSVHRPGTPLGARVEIKNMNSFRHVSRAIRYEEERQTARLDGGLPVDAETRAWSGDHTVGLRRKEGPADYRYLDEPDLPPLQLTPADLASATAALPGVPLDVHLAARDRARHADWQARYGLDEADVRVLLGVPQAARMYADAVAAGGAPREMANLVKGEVLRRINEGTLGRVEAGSLADAAALVAQGVINREAVRTVLDVVAREGGAPAEIAQRLGLGRESDPDALRIVVTSVVAAHPDARARYRAGNRGLLGFFIGEVMAATARKADPKLAARLVREALEGTS